MWPAESPKKQNSHEVTAHRSAFKKRSLCRASSLKDLGFWPGKLLAGFKATIKGPSAAAANVCSWLYPVADFIENIQQGQPDCYSPTSIRLAESLLRQASQHAVHLLAKLLKVSAMLLCPFLMLGPSKLPKYCCGVLETEPEQAVVGHWSLLLPAFAYLSP